MGDFRKDRGKRFNGSRGGGFGGRDRGFGGRDRGPVTMHPAICAECGKPCEVPFRPVEGKPVYCSICFRDKREGGGGKFQEREVRNFAAPASIDGGGHTDEVKGQLVMLNSKMDQLIRIMGSMANPKTVTAKEKNAGGVKKPTVKKVFKKTKRK